MMKLSSDPIMQLLLLKNTTFADKVSFIDEAIQNAQRAKAKTIRVRHNGDTIIIENDGAILADPQSLFSMSESGWKDDDVMAENPFGIGFFSNTVVSNYIEIHTGNMLITFDVDKCISERSTNIESVIVDEVYEGFKLTLKNIDASEIGHYSVRKRVESIGKYLKNVDVYFDGTLVEKEDLATLENKDFEFLVNQDSFEGNLFLTQWETFEEVSIFYKGRSVCKVNVPNLGGRVHISDGILNLTSPDRKNIVQDGKLREFKDKIKNHYKDLLTEYISTHKADKSVMGRYEGGISRYCSQEVLNKSIPLYIIDPKCEEKNDFLSRFIDKRKSGENISFEEFSKKDKSLSDNKIEDVSVELKTNSAPNPTGIMDTEGSYSSGSHSDGDYYHPSMELDEYDHEITLDQLIKEYKRGFFVSYKDAVKYEKQIRIGKHFNIFFVLTENKIDESICRDRGYNHISLLDEKVITRVEVNEANLTIQDKRGLSILNYISNSIGEGSIFKIGDLTVKKEYTIKELDLVNVEEIEAEVPFVYSEEDNRIYIDKKYLVTKMLNKVEFDKLRVNDYRFVFANFYELEEVFRGFKFTNKNNFSKVKNQILQLFAK